MGNSKFKPGKAISIFVLFFFPLLILLGVWQVNRGIEKGDLLALYASNKSMHPMKEEDFFNLNISNNKYRNLFLSGEYLPKVFFLDNRTYRNKAGFEVFSLFQTKKNNIFLINRGWSDKKIIKDKLLYKPPTGTVQIEGLNTPFHRLGLEIKSSFSDLLKEPLVFQELTFKKVLNFLDKGMSLNPVVIQLSVGSPGAFEPIWKPALFRASRHFGYAAQWFGLSLVLLILYVYFGVRQATKANEETK